QVGVRRAQHFDRRIDFLFADEVPERAVRREHRAVVRDDRDGRRRRLDDVLVVLLERLDLFELAAQAAVQARVLDRQRDRRRERLEQMKVVARERLVAALRAEEEKALQLTAMAQRENVAVAGPEQMPRTS